MAEAGQTPVPSPGEALRHIGELLRDSSQPSSTLGKVLSLAASVVPAELLVLARIRPETDVPELVSRAGPWPAKSVAALLKLMPALAFERGLFSDTQRRGPCHVFAVPAGVMDQGAAPTPPCATAFVLPGGDQWLDVLLVATAGPAGPGSEATDFLSLMLMLVQLFAERERNRREAGELHSQVERAKRQWEASVDALPQLICLLASDGAVVRANRALETWLLGEVKTVTGTEFTALLGDLGILQSAGRSTDARCGADAGSVSRPIESSEPERGPLWSRWRETLLGGSVALDGLEGRGGRVFDLRIQDCPLADANGGVLPHYVAVLEDVTERNQARRVLEGFNKELRLQVADKTEALLNANRTLEREIEQRNEHRRALKLSEYRYQTFVERTPVGIYLAEDGLITYHNGRFANLLGYGTDELVGKRLFDVLGEPCLRSAALDADLRGDEFGGRECQVKCRDGHCIWIYLSQVPYPETDRDIVLGSVLDITVRKESERRLIKANARTAQLSEQLLVAQEQERRRIARDLHDGVAQRINSMKLTLDQIIGQCAADAGEKYRSPLVELAGSLRAALEEVRRVSIALRPSMLDDLGIAATLRWFVRDFARAAPQIHVDADIALDESGLEPLLKTEIFRIVQEAFNNIATHANADAVRLSLIAEDGQVALTVRDNGTGIAEGAHREYAGIGLHSMQERAELTGGDLFIVTRDGGGVAVIGRWPRGNENPD